VGAGVKLKRWPRHVACAVLAMYGLVLGHEPLMAAMHHVADMVGSHSHHSEDTHVDHDCHLFLLATSAGFHGPGECSVDFPVATSTLSLTSSACPYIADLPGVPSLRGPPASLLS